MPYPKIKKIDGSIYLKSRALHATNIWNDNIDYEINDSYHVIPITSIINIEQYALWSNFVIQSCNGFNEKSITWLNHKC